MINTIKKLTPNPTQIPQKNGIFTFLNPYSYLIYRKNLKTYENFDGIYFDGIALCKAMHLAGIRTQRISFDMTSIAPKVFNWASKNEKTIFFIGSTEDSVKKFSETIRKTFPMLSIKGFRNGYFESDSELDASILDILNKNPDIVVVGMGAPLQEEYLLKLRDRGWRGIGYTCGGFIHQTANKGMEYYPKIFDTLNLRWLYRIYDEPKLLKRYLINYPAFLFLFSIDLLKFKATHCKIRQRM